LIFIFKLLLELLRDVFIESIVMLGQLYTMFLLDSFLLLIFYKHLVTEITSRRDYLGYSNTSKSRYQVPSKQVFLNSFSICTLLLKSF
jgi:hypothetical protein